MDRAQNSDLGHVLGDWSQSEKLSEIKPPLPRTTCRRRAMAKFSALNFVDFFRPDKVLFWDHEKNRGLFSN